MKTNSKTDESNGSMQESEIDFRKLFDSLMDQKWILLGCMAGTLLLGLFYILETPKTYSATSVVQVEQEQNKFVNIEDINSEDLKQAEVLKTIEANLTSSSLLLDVIQNLKLKPEDLGMKPSKDGTPFTDEEEVMAFSGSVTVKLVRGTRLINITASNTNPLLAQAIADEIPKAYARINTAQRAGLSSEANKFLLEECDVLKHQVELAEQEAQDFKDAHPGVAMENSQDFYNEKLLALDAKLNDAKERLFKLQSDKTQADRLLAEAPTGDQTAELLKVPSVSNDANVLQLEGTVTNAEAALAQLAKRYRPKHPSYIQAQAQLDQLNKELSQAVYQAAEGLATSEKSAVQTEANFETEVKTLEKAKLANDKVAIPYNALSREVDTNRELYDEVRMRLKETEITRDIDSNEIRIATPAMLPLTPSKPKKMLVILASLLGGFILGTCVSYGMSVIDTSFTSVDEAERGLGAPALAGVPEFKKAPGDKQYLITHEPDGAIAEAFRTLRVSLSIESGEAERNVIMVTSAVPGEGKSFCAINAAISMAQLGQPTLLIDADLRLPTVADGLLGYRPKVGMNTVLTGKTTLEEAVQTVPGVPNLHVLAAGGRVSNPAELLARPRMRQILKEAAEKYPWVIIDSAPVLAVSDTLLLVKHVKSICFVIHAGKTPARVVKRAVDQIENAIQRKPTGIVLNHISHRNSSYYYYYSGDYGKGVYGATEKST